MASIDPSSIFFKSERQLERDRFINNLKDYQWECHLRKTAEIVKDKTISKLKDVKSSIKALKVLNAVQGPENGATQSGSSSGIHLDLSNLNLGPNLPNLAGLNEIPLNNNGEINFEHVARTVLGSNNVISREREASGMVRRFLAHMLDMILMLTWMLGWIYYFYLNNIYVLHNVAKFWTEELPDILDNAMIEPDYGNLGTSKYSSKDTGLNIEPGYSESLNADANDGDSLDYIDNIDMERFLDGLLSSKYINGIEDDIVLFCFFYKIMSIFYETVFIWFFGRTLGKALMHIEVVHYASFAAGGGNGLNATPDVMVIHNSSMTVWRSLCRSVAKTLYFFFIFPLVFFLMPFSTMGSQCYDRLTKTMVVKRIQPR